jgi:hypothetical protein
LSFSKLSRKQKIIFLAGVCEGEGSFGYWKEGQNRRRIRLVITMSDEDIIMRFKDFFNCGSITKVGLRQEHYKQCWTWSVGGLDALIVLEQMLPLFGARRTSKYYSMIDAFRIRIKTGDHLVQKNQKKKLTRLLHAEK